MVSKCGKMELSEEQYLSSAGVERLYTNFGRKDLDERDYHSSKFNICEPCSYDNVISGSEESGYFKCNNLEDRVYSMSAKCTLCNPGSSGYMSGDCRRLLEHWDSRGHQTRLKQTCTAVSSDGLESRARKFGRISSNSKPKTRSRASCAEMQARCWSSTPGCCARPLGDATSSRSFSSRS